MKNKIYYLGLIATTLVSLGCLYKIMHWPFAGIMLTVGMLILAILFLPLAVRSSYKAEPNKKLKTLYILVAIVFAIDFIGSLFKVMHWPGANVLIMISLPLPFVVLLPYFLISHKDDKEIDYRNFMAILFFFAYFAAISALLSLSVQKNVINAFIYSSISSENKTKVVESACLYQTNNAKPDSVNLSASKKKKISEDAAEIISKIEEIKKMILVINSGNASEAIDDKGNIDLWKTKYKESGVGIDEYYLNELKALVIKYRETLLNECSNDAQLSDYIRQNLNTDSNGQEYYWEKQFTKDKILVSSIDWLDRLKFKIRLIEFEAVAAM
ncbi:MAG TPA: hypothetical protein VIO15_13560 [Bacteroidales bacterium]